ncbi:MAG TPA: hypothetical protein VGM25_17065 [Caulobacteraceae bacterium]|jgi:hypothetical protein
MTTDRVDHPHAPAARLGLAPVTRAFIGGAAVGLIVGLALGFVLAGAFKGQPKWADSSVAFVRLPEQAALGAPPQTVTLPASSFDFGGVGAPLDQTAIDAGSIVKVEVKATAGRVGVSLARPDGGDLVSKEIVVTPQQGKTTVYFRTGPGMGPVDVLLRSADNTPAGASAEIGKVQTARQADIGQGEMDKINRAGLN